MDSGEATLKEVAVFLVMEMMVSDRIQGDGYRYKQQRVGGGVWVGSCGEFFKYANGNATGVTRTFVERGHVQDMLDHFEKLGWIRKRRAGNGLIVVIDKFFVKDEEGRQQQIDASSLNKSDPIEKWLNPPLRPSRLRPNTSQDQRTIGSSLPAFEPPRPDVAQGRHHSDARDFQPPD